MENNLVLKEFKYKNKEYQLYFDTLYEKIWVERKVLEELSNKCSVHLSRAISHLLIDGLILQSRNIKYISINKNKKILLYDRAVLKEILTSKIYIQLITLEKELVLEYNKEHKKIYFKNGLLFINRYLVDNILDIKLSVTDLIDLLEIDKLELLNTMKKPYYDIYDLFGIIYIYNNDRTKEIRNYLSNVLIKCIVDGYYINNDLCINNKEKIINITKIADNIINKEKLDDEEKKKYYKNTISYKGELYESNTFIKKLIQKAREEIIVISKFMDDDIFTLLNNACVKITLYSSTNSLVTKYNTSLFNKNHNLSIYKKYMGDNTYILIDNEIYFFDVSIINILKQNSICLKKDITRNDLLKQLRI